VETVPKLISFGSYASASVRIDAVPACRSP